MPTGKTCSMPPSIRYMSDDLGGNMALWERLSAFERAEVDAFGRKLDAAEFSGKEAIDALLAQHPMKRFKEQGR